MQFALFSLAAIFASMAVAAPAPAAGGIPGPPAGKFSRVKQQCQAHQANIRCCSLAGNNNGGNNKYNIQFDQGSFAAICDQDITNADKNQLTSNICSVTVACCIGDGCVAIAN